MDNAEKIRHGDPQLKSGNDFVMCGGLEGKELEDAMVEKYKELAQKYGPQNVYCLSPVKKNYCGVVSLNQRIRDIMNPVKTGVKSIMLGGMELRLGDRVMELKNTQTTSNGDIGCVVEIDEKEECVTVLFDGRRRETYYSLDTARLTLAYAMTVHKAQGSEMKAVILCLQDCNGLMLKRSIPYTGITRAQEQVVFMGSIEALKKAVKRDDKYERKTMLREILQDVVYYSMGYTSIYF